MKIVKRSKRGQHPRPEVKPSIEIPNRLDALLDSMGSVGAIASNVFRLCGVAEEMIAGAKKAHPQHVAEVDSVFKAACPSAVLRGKHDTLYKAHIAELIQRAVKGESPKPPTDAEMLAALSDLSLKAPPGPATQHVFEVLFFKIYPEKRKEFEHDFVREPYAGSRDEVLRELRRKLTVHDRQFNEAKKEA